jgi:hypothetical protein
MCLSSTLRLYVFLSIIGCAYHRRQQGPTTKAQEEGGGFPLMPERCPHRASCHPRASGDPGEPFRALTRLGMESSSVLNHATPRSSYGCEPHPRAREELLGLYPITESEGASTSLIASLWRQRWLANRIRSEDVLAKVAAVNSATLATFFFSGGPGRRRRPDRICVYAGLRALVSTEKS